MRTSPVSLFLFAFLTALNFLLWQERTCPKTPLIFCEELLSNLGILALTANIYFQFKPSLPQSDPEFKKLFLSMVIGCLALNLYTYPKYFPASLNPNTDTAPFLEQIVQETKDLLAKPDYHKQLIKATGYSDSDRLFACCLQQVVLTHYVYGVNTPRCREPEVPPQIEDLMQEYQTYGSIYGNCWDISSLLTACLRQAGYPAETQTGVYFSLNAQVGHCSVSVPGLNLKLYDVPAPQWYDGLNQVTYSWGVSPSFAGWHGYRNTIVYFLLMITFLLPFPRLGNGALFLIHSIIVFYLLFADMPKVVRMVLLTGIFIYWPLWELLLRNWYNNLIDRMSILAMDYHLANVRTYLALSGLEPAAAKVAKKANR